MPSDIRLKVKAWEILPEYQHYVESPLNESVSDTFITLLKGNPWDIHLEGQALGPHLGSRYVFEFLRYPS